MERLGRLWAELGALRVCRGRGVCGPDHGAADVVLLDELRDALVLLEALPRAGGGLLARLEANVELAQVDATERHVVVENGLVVEDQAGGVIGHHVDRVDGVLFRVVGVKPGLGG